MTSVLVIVLNWNGIEDTKECLSSLFKQTYKNYKIAVVDNGSTDNSIYELKLLEKEYTDLILIENGWNMGFAGGVNSGIKYALQAGFDSIALLNNDAIADKDWLKGLVDNINEDTGIVTGALLHRDGKTIDSTGEQYSTWGIPYPRNRNDLVSEVSESSYIFGATGGASLYISDVFRKIGLFDEVFFVYFEDVDISFRAQLAGFKVYYTKDAIAYHKQGASSKKVPGLAIQHTFKNLPLLFWKNMPLELLIPVGARLCITYTLIFGNAIKNGAGLFAFKGWVGSIWYFWTSALWQRFKIQKNKKVTADYIWSILYHDLPPEQTGMRKFRAFFTGKK